jgi:hypothetical protein
MIAGAPATPLAVSVIGTDITVTLGTDATGALVFRAWEVSNALNSSAEALALVYVTNSVTGSTGNGVVTPVARTALSGGSDGDGVAAGNVEVEFDLGASRNEVSIALREAINALGLPLQIQTWSPTADELQLNNDRVGSAGNQPIVVTGTGITVSGMSGGSGTACAAGTACFWPFDCASGTCSGGVCL